MEVKTIEAAELTRNILIDWITIFEEKQIEYSIDIPEQPLWVLAKAKDILAKQGYDLEVTEFEDYVQPNEVVESGEFDANYFQHIPYLDSFNKEKGTHKS